jgi:23S rRNA pseudouridine2605 synthase
VNHKRSNRGEGRPPRERAPDRGKRRAGAGRKPPGQGVNPRTGARGASERDEAAASPQKLHKVLALAGLGSRREIEDWIGAGRIMVNGRVAQIGQRVGLRDRIQVDGRPVRLKAAAAQPKLLLYHKPTGEIVSRDDPEGRPSVFDRLPRLRGEKWIAVGRLDFNTEGLLIFTTSGELANRLMHPRYEMEREYAVRVLGELSPEQMEKLTSGVRLADGTARFDSLEEAGGAGANRWYRVIIREGRYREVRRMFEALGLTLSRLIRVRYGPLSLPPRLKRGTARPLASEEVARLLDTLSAAGRGSPSARQA